MLRAARRAGAVVLAAVVLAGVLVGCGGSDEAGDGLSIAAASDLRSAFEELGGVFTETTGTPVTFSFGSSGQLSQQIRNGAPFDLFASADISYVDDVIGDGLGDASTKRTYAFGRIVIWSKGAARTGFDALRDESITAIAIANPDHAPYGVAARTALQRAGVYEAITSRLVYGENVSDTLRLAESGNADVAIVALSLAIPSDGTWTLVDEVLHDPLEQALVVTAPTERAADARAFADSIAGPQGRAVMERYGFLLPGDPAPPTTRDGR